VSKCVHEVLVRFTDYDGNTREHSLGRIESELEEGYSATIRKVADAFIEIGMEMYRQEYADKALTDPQPEGSYGQVPEDFDE
jgi:hypothetical protein